MYNYETILQCNACNGNILKSHFDIKGTIIDIDPFAVDIKNDSLVFCMPINEMAHGFLEQLAGLSIDTDLLASPINMIHIECSFIYDKDHYWSILINKTFFHSINYCDYGEDIEPYYRIDFKTVLRPQVYYRRKVKNASDN